MKIPRSLADLAFADSLSPLREDFEPDGDYDRVLIADASLTGAAAGGSRFMETALVGMTFNGGNLRRCRLTDVWFGETRLVTTDLAESDFTDAWLSGCVLAGVQAFSATMRRVTFRGCKLDSVNFRACELTDVAFEDCALRDVDFATATLTRVRFGGSTLTGADFTKVECASVDLRGASLGITAGFDSLRGVTIDSLQLMTLAPQLAHHLGITVQDGGS